MGAGKKKGYDRNYWALALEGASFMGGVSMMATGGVVSLFVDTMTGSKTLVGLAVTTQALFMLLGQLFCAPHMSGIRDLPGFMFKGMFSRAIPFLMAIPLFLGADRMLSVFIFLFLYGMFWLVDGILTVPWGELSARALRPELRGHMMGMQIAIGGALSLLTGLLLTWLFANPRLDEYSRFGTIFMIAACIFLMSLVFIRMVKDPSPTKVLVKPDLKRYYSRIPQIIRGSKPLQHAMIARMPGYVGFSSITFLVVFGSDTLSLSGAQLSWLVYAQIVGSLTGGIILGETSRRFGNKTVSLLCNAGVLVTLGAAVSLFFFPALGYLFLISACAFASIWYNNWLGYFNYFLDIAPREDRPTFQVVGNCVGIPFSFVGFGIGAIIDRWGFLTAFVVGGLAAITAILLSTRLLSRKRIKAGDMT